MQEQAERFDVFLGLFLTKRQKELLRRIAELEGVSLSEFAREALRKEIERRLGADAEARP